MGIKWTKSPKTFIHYSQTTDNVYEKLEDYNSTKKTKVSIMFNDMIADIEVNKKLKPIVAEWLMREKGKRNVSVIFRSQYYSAVPKTIRLNATHYFII